MRDLATLLSELGDCQLVQFIALAGDPLSTKRGREMAGNWAFGYLGALRDFGRITAEEYE
ncbi:hypothetical protein [Pseudomonas sp. UBA2684]|uniref:hypothetical protein n=1 Tax=Pseudomonas sp. UBA2684 TaxID=1947311 RepID=UPI0025E2660F|nr:hypothetical protein [Pseudomonas sp. UBA2684]|tara:strand:+ start:4757 stop:4936 length:180 start_codon:yes stop_codon:yes gene_type:complete